MRRFNDETMNHPICRFALTIVILMAAAVPAFSQAGAISGTVTDLDGKPLANATVGVDRTQYGQHSEVKTNNKGVYLYRGEFGLYRVTVYKDGNPVAAVDGIRLNFQDTLTQNFDLRTQGQDKGPAKVELDKAQREAENRQPRCVLSTRASRASRYEDCSRCRSAI